MFLIILLLQSFVPFCKLMTIQFLFYLHSNKSHRLLFSKNMINLATILLSDCLFLGSQGFAVARVQETLKSLPNSAPTSSATAFPFHSLRSQLFVAIR